MEEKNLSQGSGPAPMPVPGVQPNINTNPVPPKAESVRLQDIPVTPEAARPVETVPSAAPASVPPAGEAASTAPERVPEPPSVAQDINIRTMESDMSSLKETGGAGVVGQSFTVFSGAQKQQSQEEAFSPESLSGTEKAFEPQTTEAPAKEDMDPERKRRKMRILMWVIIFVIAGTVAGYFFVGPLVAPGEEAPEVIPEDEPIEEPVTPAFTHTTFFATAPDTTTPVTLPSVSASDIRTAVAGAKLADATAGTMQEVVFSANGTNVDAQNALSVLLPESDISFISTGFDKDMTAFVYYDENGAWPGYIFKVVNAADPVVRGQIQQMIEGTESTVNFFAEDPGAPKGGFKDGNVIEGARYRVYTQTGAGLNYGWKGDHLIVSTSYNGIKEAAGMLQAAQ